MNDVHILQGQCFFCNSFYCGPARKLTICGQPVAVVCCESCRDREHPTFREVQAKQVVFVAEIGDYYDGPYATKVFSTLDKAVAWLRTEKGWEDCDPQLKDGMGWSYRRDRALIGECDHASIAPYFVE